MLLETVAGPERIERFAGCPEEADGIGSNIIALLLKT
jgi:hypothetical protein